MAAVLIIGDVAIGYRGEAEQRDRQAGGDFQGAGVPGPRCGDRARLPALDESLVGLPAEIRDRPAARGVVAQVACDPDAPSTITQLAIGLGML